MIYDENYGYLTREQKSTYKKFNVSPADHDYLVYRLGDSPVEIVRYVKEKSAPYGYFIEGWGV